MIDYITPRERIPPPSRDAFWSKVWSITLMIMLIVIAYCVTDIVTRVGERVAFVVEKSCGL